MGPRGSGRTERGWEPGLRTDPECTLEAGSSSPSVKAPSRIDETAEMQFNQRLNITLTGCPERRAVLCCCYKYPDIIITANTQGACDAPATVPTAQTPPHVTPFRAVSTNGTPALQVQEMRY